MIQFVQNFVIEEVRKKQKEPESDSGEPDDFDNIIEDKGKCLILEM